ncbi:MAG: phosphate acyltransferase PlsX [candidate division WOR-3 bacterium]|nr:phosphate acyltransferase PlsX [candidate division WOR-3 bacterium]
MMMIRIGIDAMGGDNAPGVMFDAVSELVGTVDDVQFVLIGKKDILEEKLPEVVEIVDAPEVIEADELPSIAFRSKKKSSIAVGIELQKKGEIDAFISAGNTGAFIAFATLGLGRLKNVKKAGLATFFPTKDRRFLVIDVGANADAKPEHLLQYGIMGSIYTEEVMRVRSPRVGILSIGEEEIKGSTTIKEAGQLLKSADINFVGNIEGHMVLRDVCDVLVCDGFVGNSLLKFGEGVVTLIMELLEEGMDSSLKAKLGGLLMRDTLYGIVRRMNYDEIGGAIILGVKGINIVCHGRSGKQAIKNALQLAIECKRHDINHIIEQKLGGKPIITRIGYETRKT